MTIVKKLLLIVLCLGTGFSFTQNKPTLNPDVIFHHLAKVHPVLDRKEFFLGTTILTPGIALFSTGHKLVVKHGAKVIGNAFLRIPGAGLAGLGMFLIADTVNKTS